MRFVGCDVHTHMQQVAVLDTETGELSEQQLIHDGMAIEEFYTALPYPVTVGKEQSIATSLTLNPSAPFTL